MDDTQSIITPEHMKIAGVIVALAAPITIVCSVITILGCLESSGSFSLTRLLL